PQALFIPALPPPQTYTLSLHDALPISKLRAPTPIALPPNSKAENVPPNLLPNEFEWPRPKAAMSLLFLPLSLRHPPSALSEALSATHSSTQSNITPVNICGTCTAKSATLTWPKPRYVASRIDQRFLNSIVTHYRPPNKMQSLISVRFRVL